ncbi:MAG: LuxR family transcriptional regulator [Ramlibacter sp.]|jgi:DNA-binding NarL/FixJ family response regulator|nr:LuxR family transcriptional regulator [Ramlibacter sp.]
MFRLLICDDHPAIRTALRLLARDALPGGCDVIECASAEELLALLEQDRPFDFVTLDLQLPGRSGLDVLAEVKQMRPDLPVMVFSADENPERVTEALQAGATSYLFKSASEQVLTEALRAAAAHRPALPAPYARDWKGTPGADDLPLSARQREVLQCLLRGMSAKQIARALGISDGTVKSHTVAVFRALNVSSRAQVVLEAHRRGIPFGG